MRETVESPREPLKPIEVRSREITVDGVAWLASEGGRTASGRGVDSRASLLLVLFARASDGGAQQAVPTREALTVVPDLDHLADDELIELCARARPYKAVQDRSEVFPDTRKKGQRGL